MTEHDETARRQILARLAASREELRQMLDPVRTESNGESSPGVRADGFPRSRTMRMLLSGRGAGTLAAVAGGLFIARPALALRLIRMLPASAVVRWAVVRAITALKGGAANGADRGAQGPGAAARDAHDAASGVNPE